MLGSLRKLFKGPLILVHIVAQRDLRIDIISEQVDVRLLTLILGQRGELEESFLN